MKKRVPFLIVAILVMSFIMGTAFILRGGETSGQNIIAEISGSDLHIDGETQSSAGLQQIGIKINKDTAVLTSEVKPDAITLRLTNNDRTRFYDLEFAKTLSMKGFLPNTRVSLISQDKTLYDDVPMDWNGRINLPAPATPFDLSFKQGDDTYLMRIVSLSGGAI